MAHDGIARFFEVAQSGPFERGHAYGVAAKDWIARFLNDRLAQIHWLRSAPLAEDRALSLAGRYLDALAAHLPALHAEVLGMSRGAQISPQHAMLLQTRRELIGWSEDCTSLAFRDPVHGMVIAQTIDLSGELDPYLHLICHRGATAAGGDILMWTYAGLLGYAGVNSHGLAIGINMVVSGGWRIGIPPYLLIRHLLTLGTLEDCLREIGRLPRASSRSLMLCQGGRLLNVEMTVHEHRVREGDMLSHCNHFLHPELQPYDQVPATSTTFVRTARLQALLQESSSLNLERARAMLSDHGNFPQSICAHADDPRRGHTVSAIVMLPAQAAMDACFGNPCQQPFMRYSLSP